MFTFLRVPFAPLRLSHLDRPSRQREPRAESVRERASERPGHIAHGSHGRAARWSPRAASRRRRQSPWAAPRQLVSFWNAEQPTRFASGM